MNTSVLKKMPIILGDSVRIPSWVNNLKSFRRWATSVSYPARGRFSFLDSELWVDLDLEQLFTHNSVKNAFTAVLTPLTHDLGYFFSDRALLSSKKANLATEPDACFLTWEALETRRIKLVKGAREGFVELEGTPDLVLEVVSAGSVRKDTEVLRELYWIAGIAEYWLVDARGAEPRFDILRHGDHGYTATRKRAGWLKSDVLGLHFRLVKTADRLGNPQFKLETRG